MKTFDLNKMPELIKILFKIQQTLADTNSKETLRFHYKKIDELLRQTQILVVWKDLLHKRRPDLPKELIPEIFMDAYISVAFACMGMYKQANVSLRGELETALRLVYFSTHQVEFRWWYKKEKDKGETDYLRKNDPIGEGYAYFRQLEEIRNFQEKCKDEGHKIILFDEINKLYSKLSQFVHSGVSSFQTTSDRFSPRYDNDKFKSWVKNFEEVQKYVNTIVILGFKKEFLALNIDIQKKILKVVGDKNYKKGLRKSLNLKFRGPI